MANPEHLAILKQGVEAWNKWRRENLEVEPDLSGANLLGAHLSEANLRGVDLEKTNLTDAKLDHADLVGADLIAAILITASFIRADLSNANLKGANIIQANLSGAKLHYANFMGSQMFHLNLSDADLTQANLTFAFLRGADFRAACLQFADLSGASLIDADLSGANLSGACLDDANLSGWQIDGVTCTHIMQRGQRIDFAPGEFEKRYTFLESVTEVMLRLPLSDLTLYAGPLMAQAVNQAHGQAVVQFKGVEALSDDTTSLKFVLFAQAQEEIKASLQRIELAINQRFPSLPDASPAGSAPDEPDEIVGLRKSLAIPFTPLEMRPQAMEEALNRRFAALPPGLQKLWQIMQAALKP